MKAEINIKYKICIIGGGLVGSYSCLVARIKNPKASITVVEIGPHKDGQLRKDIEFEPIFEGQSYKGASTSRYFGLGGTSNLWSGQLIPYPRIEEKINPKFKNIVRICETYSSQVLHVLGIPHRGEKFFQNDAGVNFLKLSSVWISPLKRNFSRYLKFADTVLTNTLAVDYEIENHQIRAILIQDEHGHRHKIDADLFLLTAGAIESGRLIMEISSRLQKPSIQASTSLSGLSDHITFPIAVIHDWAKYRSILEIEPKFSGFNLITHRYISKKLQRAIYFDFLFNYQKNPALLALLKYIADLQKKFSIENLLALKLKDLLKILYVGIACMLFRKLPNSKILPIHLHCAYSQNGLLNKISLSGDKEICGRSKLRLLWEINPKELHEVYEEACETAIQLMNFLGIKEYKMLALEEVKDLDGQYSPFDVAHPAGITPIGSEIVDDEFRVLGLENFYTISSAVLPDPGTVNPTFSLLCIVHYLFNRNFGLDDR